MIKIYTIPLILLFLLEAEYLPALRHHETFDLFIAGAPYHSETFLQADLGSMPGNFNRKKYFYSFYGLKDNPDEKNCWDSLSNKIREKSIGNFSMINHEYPDEGHYAIIFRNIPDGLKMAFARWGYIPEAGRDFSFDEFRRHDEFQQAEFNVSFTYSDGFFISNSLSL